MRASGRGGALSGYCGALSSIAGSGGASETAFASMRLGSSQMTPQYCRFGRSGDEAEARGGHGAGLARHGVGKALALERGRQAHFTASKKAG